jgi:hypothetical protein
MAKFQCHNRTDTPELRLAKKRAEQIFRSGDSERIEAISDLLETFAKSASRWAREQKAKRAKLTVIHGGFSAGREHPGASEVQS